MQTRSVALVPIELRNSPAAIVVSAVAVGFLSAYAGSALASRTASDGLIPTSLASFLAADYSVDELPQMLAPLDMDLVEGGLARRYDLGSRS